MPNTIDDKRLQILIDQKLSEKEIAKQLDVTHAELRRHLQKQNGAPKVHRSTPKSTPPVHKSAQDDLADMLAWWRERKQLSPNHETERKTYHVEKQLIAAIEREAHLEGVNITEIVNRAFRYYFARKQS